MKSFDITFKGTSYYVPYSEADQGKYTRLATLVVVCDSDVEAKALAIHHLLSSEVRQQISRMEGHPIGWDWKLETCVESPTQAKVITADLGLVIPA